MGFSPRTSDSHWFRVGTIDVTTTVLITALACVSMFLFAASPHLLTPLDFNSDDVLHGQIWRFVTWPFDNPPAIQVAINIAMYWYFGSYLERLMGRSRFLRFTALLILLPTILTLMFAIAIGHGLAVQGMGLLTPGIIAAFCAAMPGAQSFFGIKLWVLGAVYLGISVLALLGLRDWVTLLFLLLMVGIGLVGARSYGISGVAWIPRIPLPALLTGDTTRREVKKEKRATHLKVVREVDMDKLLDKIAEQGIGSLTDDERRRLDDHSQRRRDV